MELLTFADGTNIFISDKSLDVLNDRVNVNLYKVAALIDLTNRNSVMLEENKYVRCLLIDFAKAFDSIDHLTLLVKLKNLIIADNIIQCVVAFLTDRNQFVKIGE